MTALFVLIVASFPSDTEAEQDGGAAVSMSEQTMPKKKKKNQEL